MFRAALWDTAPNPHRKFYHMDGSHGLIHDFGQHHDATLLQSAMVAFAGGMGLVIDEDGTVENTTWLFSVEEFNVDQDMMKEAGFTVNNGGKSGDFYTRTLRDGTYAIAGNVNGPWGWDTYANHEDYEAGVPTGADNGDYATCELMLAAMRAKNLI